ncbi:DoxX family protein [Prescottella equi]|uniref:DoxX family protein n=1 Tax=Rhodococcus hoagii TaxID=43767 RepID=UPI000A1096A7|nr:DoxX family protein [Prescottella equi]ORL16046.1 transmembrane invasion protein [Prescottella equi]
MTTTLFIGTIACIVANAFIAVADYVKAGFVLENSAEVNLPASVLPCLATLKLAGAVGLVVGLTVIPWLGVAAAVGLILFFIGAVVAHIRSRVFHNIAFPGLYLVLAVASCGYMVHLVVGS